MRNCHGNNLFGDIELHPAAPLKLRLGERPGLAASPCSLLREADTVGVRAQPSPSLSEWPRVCVCLSLTFSSIK